MSQDATAPRDIIAALRHARGDVIRRAVQAGGADDVRQKLRWEERRRVIDQLIAGFTDRLSTARTAGRRVFVSYSEATGHLYYQLFRAALEAEGFEVVTGFDRVSHGTRRPKPNSDTVLGKILSILRSCNLYCGILTKELEVHGGHGMTQWAPSVWTVEEKGMALSMGKPSVFLIEEGIHKDFWYKTTPEKLHYLFTARTYSERLPDAVDALKDRYEELALRSLSEGRPISGLDDGVPR